MERDAIVCHGAAEVCRDRLFLQSDYFVVPVCRTCGNFGEPAAPEGTLTLNHDKPHCQHCQSNEQVEMVEMPYAMKLFLQEITALHLRPQLVLE